MDTLVYNENIDTEDSNEQANIVGSYKWAMDIIKEYEGITETSEKNITFLHMNKVKFLENLRKIGNLKAFFNSLK